jgi:hypothetical protein
MENVKTALKQEEKPKLVKKKTVNWNEEEIDELEENKKKNPKKKIDEPKTPYCFYVNPH